MNSIFLISGHEGIKKKKKIKKEEVHGAALKDLKRTCGSSVISPVFHSGHTWKPTSGELSVVKTLRLRKREIKLLSVNRTSLTQACHSLGRQQCSTCSGVGKCWESSCESGKDKLCGRRSKKMGFLSC